MKALLLNILVASATLPATEAFTVPAHRAPLIGTSAARSPPPTPLSKDATPARRFPGARRMTSDGGDAAKPPSRPRRKRKDGKKFTPPSPTQSEVESTDAVVSMTPEPEPEAPAAPKQNVVVMQVRDVRDVVSGAPEEAPAAAVEEEEDYDEDDDEELADDEEWEYYDVDEFGNEIVVSGEDAPATASATAPIAGGKTGDESLEQLLADARQFRSSSVGVESGKLSDAEEGSSVKDTIFNVISTIVTVDFFVVIGLLVWFLAGIFCSTVLGNDAVQIAFNMNFERVTQPALGILMIGSIAGSLGNKEEEE